MGLKVLLGLSRDFCSRCCLYSVTVRRVRRREAASGLLGRRRYEQVKVVFRCDVDVVLLSNFPFSRPNATCVLRRALAWLLGAALGNSLKRLY